MLVADLALLGDLEARRRGDAGQPGMPTATPRFRSHEQPHRLDLSEDVPAKSTGYRPDRWRLQPRRAGPAQRPRWYHRRRDEFEPRRL